MRMLRFIVPAAALVLFAADTKKPIYVGARACGSCHSGAGIGHQYSKWLHSKHAMAYAVLAKPESLQIVKLSGLRQKPEKAPICLGCHSTASTAEEWEKDDAFRAEDGVQCEFCHGPGSEYMQVMRDPVARMKAGLRMPGEEVCMGCHVEKGSHVAVLPNPTVDIKKGRVTIAHPLTQNPAPGGIPAAAPEQKPGPKHVGVTACGKCHPLQQSEWRMTRHARAWAVLGTPAGYEHAAKAKIEGDPTRHPQCLKCHSTAGAPALDEGVTCEACHGAGSDYMSDAVMRDKPAALKAGLNPNPREVCKTCHTSAAFNAGEAFKKIVHPPKPPAAAEEPRYKNPINMALRPDGKELYVACEASDSVVVVDPVKRVKIAEIPVGGKPMDVAFSPDGRRAFASNRHDDTVSVIDVAARKVVESLEVHDEPHGLLADKQRLYVLNTSSNDITVFDLASLKREKVLSAGHGPWSLALSPDGGTLLVTSLYSNFAFLTPYHSEATRIDASRAVVDERLRVADANLMMGVDWHPSGKFALVTLNRTKSLVPMTRLLQGWTITNGLGVVWQDGRVDEVLLDEPNWGFADATDVACTPDGRYALVTSSGTDRVAVVDIAKLTGMLEKATPYEREHVIPNNLGRQAEFVLKHIPTRNSPRGVLVARDGRTAWVANSLDDSLTVIDLSRLEAAGRIDLGGPKTITKVRYGERLFHSANITFHKQYACHSCHPDGHVDGMAYDIEADGIGISPVDNRTLRGILDTAPFKWEGTNPSLKRQCGARLAMFFTRLTPFTPEELAAVDLYVTTIERPPNHYHTPGSRYTPAQKRGKAIFERTTTNDGREIPVKDRCVTCHFPPYYTNRQAFDVGTRQPNDRQGKFDVPHLNNIYDSAPYLHNGMAPTLEEIWTVYNPDDRHGVTNDMTKDQLNDLIEYLKTL